MISPKFSLSSANFLFSLGQIRDEVRNLVEQNRLSRHQSLYCLCEFIPPREWNSIEIELESSGFLLRDCIGDLLSAERWEND